MPRVLIPPPYRGPTLGEAELVVECETVRGAILAVEQKYPGFGQLVLDAQGKLHRFAKLFVNGEAVGSGQLDRPIGAGDELEIVAAIAGG
ncbi:MAG: MoaD/ThiS family protein [Deltaproteobacteria bacterium]|nr:MoaD/ThiS family protein [Deltaproteobacteria bacterium]